MTPEKNGSRKEDLKRLLLYLLFAFVPVWLWFALVWRITGRQPWQDMSELQQSLVSLGMLGPVLAHVTTRLITKEGCATTGRDSMMLGIELKKGKWIFFVLAILLPWLYSEMGNAFDLMLGKGVFDPAYYMEFGMDKRTVFLLPLAAVTSGVIGSFAAFGEEGGWRGYMMPKLLRLMGRRPALLLGGVIWGLWHAPLTAIGHNYGTDYPGFPWLGILRMCIMCTLMGVILTFLVAKSGSVWPAAILHAVNNAGPTILAGFVRPAKSVNPNALSFLIDGWEIALLLIAAVLLLVWDKVPGAEAAPEAARVREKAA
ncbi:MAG: CPBP family intramembrane metalloprotease [Lachnospiraceae bacterium]|nr:CPBP family intramembrane metalloprotease [Lachnospiraceae bacterium]